MTINEDQPLEDTGATGSEEIEATIIFDHFLERIQAGHPADPEQLLANYPAHADDLAPLLAAHKALGTLAGNIVPTFEDYRILRELGRGGMGIVYEAEQVLAGPPRGHQGLDEGRGDGPSATQVVH